MVNKDFNVKESTYKTDALDTFRDRLSQKYVGLKPGEV